MQEYSVNLQSLGSIWHHESKSIIHFSSDRDNYAAAWDNRPVGQELSSGGRESCSVAIHCTFMKRDEPLAYINAPQDFRNAVVVWRLNLSVCFKFSLSILYLTLRPQIPSDGYNEYLTVPNRIVT